MKKSVGIFLAAIAVLTLALTGCTTQLRPPVLPEMSNADIEAQAATDLERYRAEYLGAFPDVEVPKVERVRFISTNEWAVVISACLHEDGYPAVSSPDGGMSIGAPDNQDLPYGLAIYACNAKYPMNPRVMVELNQDQIRYLYDYYTTVATPCIEAMGFEVSNPPSLQTYLSTYPQGEAWHPYNELLLTSDEEWTQINKECPQIPDELYGL